MRDSDHVISELSNELAIAILLERRLREEGSEAAAKAVIETLRSAAGTPTRETDSEKDQNWLSAA